LCLLATGVLFAQQDTLPAPGSTLERSLKGGETHWFTVALAQGDFVEVKIEQKGVDVEIALLGPKGEKLARMDSPNADWGPEPLVAIAEVAGDYKVRVTSSAPGDAPPGKFAIALAAQRPATEEDRKHVAAERALEQAYDLGNQQDAAALAASQAKMQEALRYYQSTADRYRRGIVLLSLGLSHAQANDFKTAIEYYTRSLSDFEALADTHIQALALNNLAGGLDVQGDYSKALEIYGRALSISQASGERYNQALILSNVGKIHTDVGDWQKAAEYYSQALPLARAIGDLPLLASILHNTGDNHLELGQPDMALPYFQEELSVAKSLGDQLIQARALDSIGWSYMAQGDTVQALESYRQALNLQKQKGNKRWQALTLKYMALVYLSRNKNHEALDALQSALLLLKDTDDRRNEALTREVLGEAYGQSSQADKALESYQQALTTFTAIGDRSQQAKTLAGIARVQRDQGKMDEALRNSAASLALIEGLRTNAGSQQDRTSYFATQQDLYSFHIDLLMQMHRQNPSAGYAAQALQASEKARARSLLELLTDAHVDVRQGVDPALLEREHNLSQTIDAKAQRLMQLFGRPDAQEQQATLKKEISGLQAELQQVQAEMRSKSPAYAALTQPQPLSLKEIQQNLLDSDTVLLEYALGADRSYLWAVSRGAMNSYELPGREQIQGQVRQVYELLTARTAYRRNETSSQRTARIAHADQQLPAASAQLSRMVLGPAQGDIRDKRLLIVADGALQELPFAVLPEPGKTEPLALGHELVSLPSASTLAVLRAQDAQRPPAPADLAVFADPVFDRNDPRVFSKTVATAATSAPHAEVEENRILVHLAESSATPTGSASLVVPRLPFTRTEAQSIILQAKSGQNLLATDFEANKKKALGAALSKYRYVHFATHGYLDSENPALSALVLSLVDRNGKPQDGFLRAQDIYNMKLGADLVVLSACQTGLGKEIRGEGIVGLTRGFMYAGAPRVIVSMWSVNDRATEELMAAFYRKLFKDHMRPAAALRLAQIEMYHSKKWSAPFYWGAFIQQGEWR